MPETQQQTVIIIPARWASSRFPGKPLAEIAGKTMIQRVWQQCGKAASAARVVVATDDDRIARVVQDFGGEAVLTPQDIASGSERIARVAQSIEGDFFINVQGDEPLIDPQTIDAVVRPLLRDETFDIGTAACPLHSVQDFENPDIVKVLFAADGRALYFTRAQSPFPREETKEELIRGVQAYKHLGIYAFRRSSLLRFASLPESRLERIEKLEQLRALEHGMSIHVALTEGDTPAVDRPQDIARVEKALGDVEETLGEETPRGLASPD